MGVVRISRRGFAPILPPSPLPPYHISLMCIADLVMGDTRKFFHTTAIIAFYVRVPYANDIFFGVRTVRVFYSVRRRITVAPWRDVAIVVLTNVKFLTIGLVDIIMGLFVDEKQQKANRIGLYGLHRPTSTKDC